MFGYVVVNRPELKMKHYDEYQRKIRYSWSDFTYL